MSTTCFLAFAILTSDAISGCARIERVAAEAMCSSLFSEDRRGDVGVHQNLGFTGALGRTR